MINKTTRGVLAGLGAAALVGAVALSQTSVEAATATSNLTVSASVVANCQIETPNTLAFGDYDPAGVNATPADNLDAAADIRVRCTKGTPNVEITLGTGVNGDRTMTGAAEGEFLGYQLFVDAARTQVWGDTLGDGKAYVATSNGWSDQTVYGRVAGGQDVSVDDYEDTVVATVNF
jgi:spore coat protein U-like protein